MAKTVPTPVAWLHWFAYRGLMAVLQVLPEWAFFRLGAAIGVFAYYISPRYVRRSRVNLRHAFPERFPVGEKGMEAGDDPALERFIRRNYRYIFSSFIDGAVTPRHYRRSNWHRFTRIEADPESWAYIEPILRQRAEVAMTGEGVRPKPGLVFITYHFGPWETKLHTHALAVHPATIVARPLDSPYVYADVLKSREQNGNKIISKFGSPKELVRTLRDGYDIGMLPDQDAGQWANGIFVRFFGRWCKVIDAPAVLAIRFGRPVIPIYAYRRGLTSEVVQRIGPPIWTDGMKSTSLADVTYVIQRLHDVLEEIVREFPEQYIWFHKKWRTRPCDEPGAIDRDRDQQPKAIERSPLQKPTETAETPVLTRVS